MPEPTSDWIKTTTMETFRQDVIEQSAQRPVVVDFWAEWCAPCRQLMPMLEKLANEFQGRFCLIKINVDELPEIAGAFGVQSIPFVVAMVDGQPASHFQGVQTEPQLRKWIEAFVPSPAKEAYDQGQEHEAEGSTDLAEGFYRGAVGHDPKTAMYKIAHARVLLALNRDQECREIIDELNTRGFLEPDARALLEQLELRAQVDDSGGVQEAKRAVEASPDDLSLQLQLAEALGADGRFEEACELCLSIVAKNRAGVGMQAKEVMVGVLGLMGPKSKLASDLRRRLATAFY